MESWAIHSFLDSIRIRIRIRIRLHQNLGPLFFPQAKQNLRLAMRRFMAISLVLLPQRLIYGNIRFMLRRLRREIGFLRQKHVCLPLRPFVHRRSYLQIRLLMKEKAIH